MLLAVVHDTSPSLNFENEYLGGLQDGTLSEEADYVNQAQGIIDTSLNS